MRLTRLTAIVLMAAGVQVAAAQKIKGSDTVLPVSQEAAETYMAAHPGGRVTVTGEAQAWAYRLCSTALPTSPWLRAQ